MSVEDQYGPALKRARREWFRELQNGGPREYTQHHIDLLSHANNMALAQAEETSRLADAQEVANLIAYSQVVGGVSLRQCELALARVCKAMNLE